MSTLNKSSSLKSTLPGTSAQGQTIKRGALTITPVRKQYETSETIPSQAQLRTPLMSTIDPYQCNELMQNSALNDVSDISRMVEEVSNAGATATRSSWFDTTDEEELTNLQSSASTARTSTISKPSSSSNTRNGNDDISMSALHKEFDNTRIRSQFANEVNKDLARQACRLSTSLNWVTRRDNNSGSENGKNKPKTTQSLLNQMGFSITKTNERSSKRTNTSPLENQAKAQDQRPTPDSSMYVQPNHIQKTRHIFEQSNISPASASDFVDKALSADVESEGPRFETVTRRKKKYSKLSLSRK